MQVLVILLLMIIILIICQLFLIVWHPQLPEKFYNLDFFYYGHRGAPTIYPENTINSFKAAIDNNIDGIELDVQLTSDKQIVIYHDQMIEYNGSSTKITDLTLSQIKTINVNNTFDNLPAHNIPTLDEVLKILDDDTMVNIEIKSYDSSVFNTLENMLVELLEKYSIEDQIVISSFNPFIIKKIKALNKNISTAFIWSSEAYHAYKLSIYYAKPDAFHVDIQDVNTEMVEWMKKRNLKIYAYTVNTQDDLTAAKNYQLDGIFTDNPNIKN